MQTVAASDYYRDWLTGTENANIGSQHAVKETRHSSEADSYLHGIAAVQSGPMRYPDYLTLIISV